MSAVRGAVVALALAAACGKQDAPPAEQGSARAPAIPAAEIKRGEDACNAYVAKVCACAGTVEAAAKACALAKALPSAITTSVEVMRTPDSDKRAVLHAADAIRKTVAECIEQTAKLPELGCD